MGIHTGFINGVVLDIIVGGVGTLMSICLGLSLSTTMFNAFVTNK